MTVLSAQSIRERCTQYDGSVRKSHYNGMIFPFFEREEICFVHDKWTYAKTHLIEYINCPKFSYGLSSAGYDVRVAEDLTIWPFVGRLASTIERFDMPNDVLAEVKDKSSWARRFLTVQNTVIEPGWKGYLTLELTNHRLWPIKLKAGTPIAQIVFYQLDKPTEQSYNGKYQNQPSGPQKAI